STNVVASLTESGASQGMLQLYSNNTAVVKITSNTTSFINNSSNFGFGTSTPNWNLQVAGTRPSLAISDTGAGGTNLKHWLFSSMGGNLYIGTSTDLFATTTVSAITLLTGGNVGIATSSPFA